MSRKAQFDYLFENYNQKLFRVCLSLMGNEEDASDLLQEVYYKVWVHLSSFKNQSNIFTWAFRIAVNTALTIRKRGQNERKFKEQLPIVLSTNTEHEPIENTSYLIRGCIEKIDNKLDKIIVSLILDDASYKEVSEIIGISPNNVGVRFTRIRKKIKNCLEKRRLEL